MKKIEQVINTDKAKDSGLALVLISMIFYHLYKFELLFLFAVLFLLLTMIYPAIFKKWAFIWFGISEFLGRYVSVVVLGIAFFCVVTPIGLIRKLIGRDTLKLKHWKKDSCSVLIDRNHIFCKKDIERAF